MRKQELYLFIAVIVMVGTMFLVFLIVSFFPAQSPTKSPKTPSPSLINSESPDPVLPANSPISIFPIPSISQEEAKNIFIQKLPYTSELFNVEFYYDEELFRVTIKEAPYAENKNIAEEWFRQNGLTPENLNIYWGAYPEIQR